MKWTTDRLPHIKGVMDRYHILDRMVNRNRTKMLAAGSPCTYWRNSATALTGTIVTGLTRCYCWGAQEGAPDRTHFLCMGTGYLEGYQKYGYNEVVFSTPSDLTKSSNNLVITGEKGSSYTISGTSTSETLATARITLTNFKDVTYFLINEAINADQNRIEYYYSTDDTNWVQLTITSTGGLAIANKQASFSLPVDTSYIRFRITLKKRMTTSPAPKWNSIRFRYRKHIKLYEMDSKFNIQIPAFMAAREQQMRGIAANEFGWTITFPLEWWTLPDADIKQSDIIGFLQGKYVGHRFEVQKLREFTYGENLQVLHKSFESIYIRDQHALLGIIHYLI
jgi:hypothetical protein